MKLFIDVDYWAYGPGNPAEPFSTARRLISRRLTLETDERPTVLCRVLLSDGEHGIALGVIPFYLPGELPSAEWR